ncbi:hypothetical protein HY224_00725 [Candidatus Uhrbacteria bacterium]|nr:hypothetical protein [Candidatus Uhrbacteria bacterium]
MYTNISKKILLSSTVIVGLLALGSLPASARLAATPDGGGGWPTPAPAPAPTPAPTPTPTPAPAPAPAPVTDGGGGSGSINGSCSKTVTSSPYSVTIPNSTTLSYSLTGGEGGHWVGANGGDTTLAINGVVIATATGGTGRTSASVTSGTATTGSQAVSAGSTITVVLGGSGTSGGGADVPGTATLTYTAAACFM